MSKEMNYQTKKKQWTLYGVRRSAFIKWHFFLFFLQWCRFYKLHLINALKADFWAFKNGIKLTLKDRIDFYKWNSWNKYKAHHTYILKKQKYLCMVDAKNFDYMVGLHYA